MASHLTPINVIFPREQWIHAFLFINANKQQIEGEQSYMLMSSFIICYKMVPIPYLIGAF